MGAFRRHTPSGRMAVLAAAIASVTVFADCKKPIFVGEGGPDGRPPLIAAESASSDSIGIEAGGFFLLRRLKKNPGAPVEFAAVKLAHQIPGGMEYECYYQGDGSGDLRRAETKLGTVAERVSKS